MEDGHAVLVTRFELLHLSHEVLNHEQDQDIFMIWPVRRVGDGAADWGKNKREEDQGCEVLELEFGRER